MSSKVQDLNDQDLRERERRESVLFTVFLERLFVLVEAFSSNRLWFCCSKCLFERVSKRLYSSFERNVASSSDERIIKKIKKRIAEQTLVRTHFSMVLLFLFFFHLTSLSRSVRSDTRKS